MPKNFANRPITKREIVVEDYHGTPVADPYRWLEDDTAPDVKAWIQTQNEYFEDYMKESPDRAAFKQRLTELWHYARSTTPDYVAGQYYAWRNDGLQNQSVLYRLQIATGCDELILDPNLLSNDGTVAVMHSAFSPDGNYLAYSLSVSGSDWQTIHFMDLHTLEVLPDKLAHVKFSNIAWLPDESGVYYTRYPAQDVDSVLKAEARNSMICLHKLGTAQDDDQMIYNHPDQPDWDFRLYTDEGKGWAFRSTGYSTLFKNQLHYRPLADMDALWLTIADNFDEGYSVTGVINDVAYIYTQKDAPFGKIIAVDLTADGPRNERTIVPDNGEMLEWARLANDHLLCCYVQHAVNKLKIYKPCGTLLWELELPGPGSVLGLSCRQNRDILHVQFGGYLSPSTVYEYDFASNQPRVWFAPQINFPFDQYETRQVFYASKDGTQVPMFITAKKGLPNNGKNPTLLYGYGGFDIAMTPAFSPPLLSWLEHGGVYAVACIRGGSEYGETWHRAGMLESKQNVFDDFIAAAEYLIAQKITATPHLGIMGGSNGGLLTGACLTQRPDLYGAVIVAVPVLDMLRYHLFTAGRYWTGEYGCADNAEQFAFMYKYSPLHNVRMNAAYPPTLVMTADTDDRVVPGQARKFIATLQAADAGDNPLLVRINVSAGHGQGMPIAKQIEERADLYAFLLRNLK
ncbi:MAG: prolyl oligopeptidase family serine peptidase [Defluviitaleaceae bacterium]|nr:prolyl oligopeptidase family serine peptidase [Defluviitaleaceae bacterium]